MTAVHAAGPSPPCLRCGGSGLGNVCFPSRETLLAYCADQAAANEPYLIEHLAALPTDAERREFFERLAAHVVDETLQRLRRRVFARLQARNVEAVK